MCGHADLDDDFEAEILRALTHPLGGEVIHVKRDNIHRVKAHGFRFVEKWEIFFGEGLAEQKGVNSKFHGRVWLRTRGMAPKLRPRGRNRCIELNRPVNGKIRTPPAAALLPSNSSHRTPSAPSTPFHRGILVH